MDAASAASEPLNHPKGGPCKIRIDARAKGRSRSRYSAFSLIASGSRYDSAYATAASRLGIGTSGIAAKPEDDLLLKKRLRLHSRPDARAIGGAERTEADDTAERHAEIIDDDRRRRREDDLEKAQEDRLSGERTNEKPGLREQ
jgi:hypothetical protein